MPEETHKWTLEEENFLKRIEEQCNIYERFHNKNHAYYDTLSRRFNVPILLISAINSLTAVILQSFIPQEYVSIINATASAGTGVLGSIQLYLKLNEKMTVSLKSAMVFKAIAIKISKELTLAESERSQSGNAFLADRFSEFNAAIEQCGLMDKSLPNVIALEKISHTSSPPSPLSPRTSTFAFGTIAARLMKLAGSNISLADTSHQGYFRQPVRPKKQSFDSTDLEVANSDNSS